MVNGQSWVVGGVEYLGVGGVWTAQAAITKTVWVNGAPNFEQLPIYVDSVLGDDLNSGLSQSEAKKTLSEAIPLVKQYGNIKLKRGSHFRESLTGLPYGANISDYGTGERPIVDGSDVVTDWELHSGDCYKKTITNVLPDGARGLRVYKDNNLLLRVADVAACISTANSFYVGSLTGSDVVYVNSGANPNSDGSTYEVITRNTVTECPSGGAIRGIHATKNGWNYGAIYSNVYAYDCLATHGGKHNMWGVGWVENCHTQYNEQPATYGGSTQFVAFGDSNASSYYKNCTALQYEGDIVSVGFYSHTDGFSGTSESVIYDTCTATNFTTGFSVADSILQACLFCNAVNVSFPFACVDGSLLLLGCKSWCTDVDSRITRLLATSTGDGSFEALGCSSLIANSVGSAFVLESTNDSVLIENSTIVFEYGYPRYIADKNGFSGEISVSKNVTIDAWTGINVDNPFDGDYNCYFGTNNWTIDGVTYNSLLEYKTALTTQEQNSINTDPQITGNVYAGDFSQNAESEASILGIGSQFVGSAFQEKLTTERAKISKYRALWVPQC